MVLVEANSSKPVVDARTGKLHIRLAETAAEIYAAQALRYRVFYEEMAAQPTPEMAAAKRDFDSFDEFCDHLLVFDTTRSGANAVIGTYRVMRREAAARRGQFYTIDEYDIGCLLSYPGEIMELGRSCIDADYRTGSTMQLLWRGIAEYIFYHDVELLFGCASLPGVNPNDLAVSLTYLYHHHLAPPALRPRAIESRYVDMDMLAPDTITPRKALHKLPPLIKGYLRLGGFIGDGAVVDYQFGTTDVCIVIKTDLVTDKYIRHYAREDSSKSNNSD